MAVAVGVGHQMRAVVEEEVHRLKVTGAEGALRKQPGYSVPVSMSWVAEVAVDWRMDGGELAREVVEVGQPMAGMPPDLLEEVEEVWQC